MSKRKRVLLTYEAAGKILGISRGAVYFRHKNGQMPQPDGYLNGMTPAWYEETIVQHKKDFKDGRLKKVRE